jgi:hypothetical protein
MKGVDMRKLLCIATFAAAALLVAVPAAPARDDPGVLRQGTCSGSSTWKLKAKFEDRGIETELEVDQNVVGRRWRVTISRESRTVFSGIRRTVAPNGSFEARRIIANTPGSDRIVARARALASGETCRGAVTI